MLKSKKFIMVSVFAIIMMFAGVSSAFAAVVWESEPNDSIATADVMYLGDTAFGQASSSSDQDSYLFTPGTNRTVSGMFYPNNSSETASYYLFIYDATANTYVVSEYIPAGTSKLWSFSGIAGHLYYPLIAADRASTYYYSFLTYP